MSTQSEKLAEVGLRHQLAIHPLRVLNPIKANIFYVPVYEFVSITLGSMPTCSRQVPPQLLSSHSSRMVHAAAALRNSSHWQRCFGCDHIFASSFTDSPKSRIQSRMQPLSEVLKCATAGRYKARSGGGCQTEVPYGTNYHGVQRYEAAPEADRPLLVSFFGSLDVCCSGAGIRCAMGDILATVLGQTDVLILPSVRFSNMTDIFASQRRTFANTCSGRALRMIERASNASHAAEMRRVWLGSVATASEHSESQILVSQRAGYSMARSIFCLIPPGDNFISSRLYSAIGAGCLPVILHTTILHAAAFSSLVNYTAFAVIVPADAFLRDPGSLVPMLRSMPAPEVRQRQRALAAARPHLLFDVMNGTAAAAHFLEMAVTRCFPQMGNCGMRQRGNGIVHNTRVTTHNTRINKVGTNAGLSLYQPPTKRAA
uniref:Exostosin GT47 domain-containing protein n=1 Tax=Coccolithus braarudii TaxID=221442 RepID=A0A7S0LD72_9EUKA